MAINRKKKEELVEVYSELAENASAIVFTDYRGATVGQINGLRHQLRQSGTTYMVAKNSLLNLALQKTGAAVETNGLLEGPNAVAFLGDDIGRGMKTLKDWIKDSGSETIEIKGALLEGAVLDANGASALADLPTREEMLAKLLSTIIAPASQLVRTINEPGAGLARVIKARAESENAA